MSDIYKPPSTVSETAWIQNMDQYRKMYERSIKDPEGFWAEQAEQFVWFKKWDRVRDFNYNVKKGKIFIEWFQGGKTNITVNCLDRHIESRGDQTAILWEGNEPGETRSLTYKELLDQVCRFSNVLKKHGVKKGDRVSIYMPMIPELAVAMLACARIGAVHSIVFGGFSPTALADRIVDSTCTVVVTADGSYRGSKPVALKTNVDKAIILAEKEGVTVKSCIVAKHIGDKIETNMTASRDTWWEDEMASVDGDCEPEVMDAEDPLFILYTSGSTGKPKGAQHNVGGYMIFAALTHKYIFDYHDGDIWWCTADIGWVVSGCRAVLGCGGPPQGDAVLHRADGDPSFDVAWRRVSL
jgi:acetyl-CoA synthetase